ncbi:MAG: hypothetical protein NC483_07635 [Ruminococcus sp.]|nr:hypothetical protein [Ruminococcus sp.]
MIGRIKNNKNKLLIIFIKFVLIVLFTFIIYVIVNYFEGIEAFFIQGRIENKENKIASNYENYNSRLSYYNQNIVYLTNIIKILSEYDTIYEISKFNVCPDYAYKGNNILICSKSKISNIPINDIKFNFKKLNLSSIYKSSNKIIFKMLNTPEYRIYFNYCYDTNTCDNKNQFSEKKYGIIEENIINENWSSYYSNISLR